MIDAPAPKNASVKNDRHRMIYIAARLRELNDEKARLVAERAELRKARPVSEAGAERSGAGPELANDD